MAIEQAVEKRIFFIGCSEVREDLVGVWETMLGNSADVYLDAGEAMHALK